MFKTQSAKRALMSIFVTFAPLINVTAFSMKKLLSLPPNVVETFHDITGLSAQEYYCTSDPADHPPMLPVAKC